MSRQRFIMAHDTARNRAMKAVATAPSGYVVTIEEPAKRREQEERYHAMIGDIAAQCTFMGQRWDREDWKRLLIDAFAKVMREAGTPLHHEGRVVPSLDGTGVVQLGVQSRRFRVREASEFIEYLFAYGAEHNVRWSEPHMIPAITPEQMADMMEMEA